MLFAAAELSGRTKAMAEGTAPAPAPTTPAGAEKDAAATPKQPAPPAAKTSVMETLAEASKFKTFCEALKTAGLADKLKEKGPFTVLAPTDEAFAAIPKADLADLMKDPEKLKGVLSNHIIPGQRYTRNKLVKAGTVKTLGGAELTVKAEGKKVVLVADAKLLKGMFFMPTNGNGVVLGIDKVIMSAAAPPPSTTTAPATTPATPAK